MEPEMASVAKTLEIMAKVMGIEADAARRYWDRLHEDEQVHFRRIAAVRGDDEV